MRRSFLPGLAFLVSVLPLSAALDFNSGNLGTVGMSNTIFLFTPTGGTGPYVFSYSPTATPIPNFRVINAPELPATANANQKGGLAGLAQAPGPMSTTIRLTDTATNTFVDKAVNFTVSPVDLIGFGPSYYSIGDTVSQKFFPVGGIPPYTYTLSGTPPPGLTLGNQVVNGVNVALISGVIANTANTATPTVDNHYNFTITTHDSAGNTLGRGFNMTVSAMQLSMNSVPLNVGNNRSLPNATVGLAYFEQITAVGGTPPYTFSLAPLNALPNTLILSSNGQITGTPTAANFGGRFTLIVTDSANHYMTMRLNLKILPVVPAPLTLTTNTIGDTGIGGNFDWGFYTSGGLPPYTYNVDPATPLPPGAVLIQGWERSPDLSDADPAYLRQRIQTPGTYSFNLRVTDSAGNHASRAYSFNVTPISLNYISTSGAGQPLSDATLGVPYSRNLIPLGGTPPYSTVSTNVPAGLTVDNNALLSGTPLDAGLDLPLNFTLNDSAGHHFVDGGNVDIASTTNPGLALSGGDFGSVQAGSQYTSNLTASNSAQNPPVFTVTIVGGSLPPGLRLLTGSEFNNGGNTQLCAQLAGIPNTPGNYSFIYRVVDGLGQVGQRQIRLRVSGMAIVNTGFAAGTVGVPFTQQIDVRGGTPPYTFSLTTGSLPPGLSFNNSNGTISGTPTSTSSVNVTIQVQDSAGDLLQRTFTLNIYPIQLTGPDVLPDGIQGEIYNYTFTPSPAGSYTFNATGIPAGLSLNANTGLMSGTLNANGTFVIAVTAYNNLTGAVVTRQFTMFVSTLSNLPLIGGLPTATINVGGVPTAYLGDFLANSNLVTVLGVGSGGVQPYTISLVSPSTLPPGLSLTLGNTQQGTTNFGRWALTGVPTTPGLYTFKLRYADSAGTFEDRVVAMNITTLGLATTAPSIALVNKPYAAQLYGTGGNGTYSFALVDASFLQAVVMPPGLSLSSTGLISGTPTSTGVFTPNIQLSSGGITRRVTVTITINATADNRRIDFALGPLVGASSTGRGNVLTLSPTGGAGTHTWSLVGGSLPAGMQLLTDANLPIGFGAPLAVIAGAPPTPGTYNFRIRVDDSTGNFGIRDAVWVFSPARISPLNAPFFANTSFPPLQMGTPYSFSLGAFNARAPLTFTTDTGTLLPGGVTLSSNGLLSGTPTASGNFALFYHITDADGGVRYASTTLSVYPAGKAAGINTQAGTGSLLPSATVNAGYTLTLNDLLSPNYGTPPFTWSKFDGTIPPGISITPGGGLNSATLSGTPTIAGTYSFSLLVTDTNSNQALIKNLILIVSPLVMAPASGALPPAIAGVSYLTSVTASGGTPPYTFSKEYDSDMPAGLSLSSSGVLSGSPSTAGPFVLYIIATDAVNNIFRQRYTLNVSPVGTVVPAFTLTPQSINISYTRGDPAPAPIPISVGSTSSALSYTASAGTSPWLSLSATSGTTPGAPNAIITPGTMTAGTYNGALTFTSSAASNSPASIPVTLNIVNAVVCSYSVNPTSSSVQAAGGSGSFSVSAPSSCNWSVDQASLPNWLTVTLPGSGSGNGSVNFSAAPNPGPAVRTGNILVNGIAYTVTQFGSSCSFTLSLSSISLPAAGGNGVLGINASSTGCPWDAAPIDSWITATGPISGTGSGSVNLSFAANLSASSRTGTVNIAGQVFTANQAGVGCTFSLSSPGTAVTSSGGPVSFGINAPAGCAWTTDTGPGWITATTPTTGSGNGTIGLSIAASSTTAQRVANVLVGGQTFQLLQAGVPCSFSLSANNPVQPSGGGSGSVDIATGAGCAWTASTNSTPWITLGSSNGSGSGSLSFVVAPNATGAARSATLTVVGQNLTVNQSGPVCAYSLQSTSATVPGSGGTGSSGVLTAAGCGPWSVTSNAPSWLHVTGSASNTGPADATYSVDPNVTGADRFGTLTIAGQTFSVSEPALMCPVTLGTLSATQGEFGGIGQFTFTTLPAGCAVPIQSNTSWITLTDLSTPGTVKLAVAPNTYASMRSGTVSVGGQNFVVNQDKSTCAYTLSIFASPTVGRLGGDGIVPMAFAPAQCGPPPVILNGPPGMLTLGPVTTGPGTYTENYSVNIYQSFINYVRTTQMLINGQIFTVKQTSW